MALSLLLHERFDFVQLLQKRVSKDKPYFWLALSVRFYDLNELFMRGCSFPISSISCLHEPYRQNMRIMRFRLCPDGYGPPRLAKINNCILVFSTSIFSRMPRKSINKTKIMKKQKKKCESITWIEKILCWTDGLTHGQLWLCVCVGGGEIACLSPSTCNCWVLRDSTPRFVGPSIC